MKTVGSVCCLVAGCSARWFAAADTTSKHLLNVHAFIINQCGQSGGGQGGLDGLGFDKEE
jgi:hypothetical protein